MQSQPSPSTAPRPYHQTHQNYWCNFQVFNPLFTFTPHISDIATRASGRLQVLKALTGTSWGQDKETILLTFEAILKPIVSYAAPIGYPATIVSNISKLQRIQNRALRIATGSVLKSEIQHLHSETETLPLSNHLTMLCSQFLASALRNVHPSHALVTKDPGPRPRIPLLQTAFHRYMAGLLEDNGTIDPINYRSYIKDIHSSAVAGHLANRCPNKVLHRPAPAISPMERTLPRYFQTTLSQLRSGQCSRLNSYRHAIGISDTDLCPQCGTGSHTTDHVFNCPAAPTDLSVEDLWDSPVEVACHLAALPALASLPSQG